MQQLQQPLMDKPINDADGSSDGGSSQSRGPLTLDRYRNDNSSTGSATSTTTVTTITNNTYHINSSKSNKTTWCCIVVAIAALVVTSTTFALIELFKQTPGPSPAPKPSGNNTTPGTADTTVAPATTIPVTTPAATSHPTTTKKILGSAFFKYGATECKVDFDNQTASSCNDTTVVAANTAIAGASRDGALITLDGQPKTDLINLITHYGDMHNITVTSSDAARTRTLEFLTKTTTTTTTTTTTSTTTTTKAPCTWTFTVTDYGSSTVTPLGYGSKANPGSFEADALSTILVTAGPTCTATEPPSCTYIPATTVGNNATVKSLTESNVQLGFNGKVVCSDSSGASYGTVTTNPDSGCWVTNYQLPSRDKLAPLNYSKIINNGIYYIVYAANAGSGFDFEFQVTLTNPSANPDLSDCASFWTTNPPATSFTSIFNDLTFFTKICGSNGFDPYNPPCPNPSR